MHIKKHLSGLTNRPSFWFMRQAGRYLPEYKKLREEVGSFLDLCYDEHLATKVTLQPIERFDMDAAIIFSDITLIPQNLGVSLKFIEGKGPILGEFEIDKLNYNTENLKPIYSAIKNTRIKLHNEKSLIGFVGAPFTLACYMIDKSGGKNFPKTMEKSYKDEKYFFKLIEILSDAVIKHSISQIKAGADTIQIFDSWAGLASHHQFEKFILEPFTKIINSIKAISPDTPIISFPKNIGEKYSDFAKQTKTDILSIDHSISKQQMQKLQEICFVQGNLDPNLLAANKDKALAETKNIINNTDKSRLIFNLGHGILPYTPIENVKLISDYLLSIDKK